MNAARDRADPALDGKVVGPAGPTPLQAARAGASGDGGSKRARRQAECVELLLQAGAIDE